MVYLFVQNPTTAGYISRIGCGDMVFSFFSSVSYHLEGLGNWGARFPRLLLDLCDHGIVTNKKLNELQQELNIIETELKNYSVSKAVYDIGDLTTPIPWELLPGAENHTLSQAYVTPRGAKSYFEVFREKIDMAKSEKADIMLIFPPEMGIYRENLWQPREKGRKYWITDKNNP